LKQNQLKRKGRFGKNSRSDDRVAKWAENQQSKIAMLKGGYGMVSNPIPWKMGRCWFGKERVVLGGLLYKAE